MEADSQGAADEEDGDGGRAEAFEFCKAVRVVC